MSEDLLRIVLLFGLAFVVFIGVAFVIFLSKDSEE